MLYEEEVYQLRERGAMSFGPSSAAVAVSLMSTSSDGFHLREMSMQGTMAVFTSQALLYL